MGTLFGRTNNGISYEVDFNDAGGDRISWTALGRDENGQIITRSGVVNRPPVGDRSNPHETVRHDVERKFEERDD